MQVIHVRRLLARGFSSNRSADVMWLEAKLLRLFFPAEDRSRI